MVADYRSRSRRGSVTTLGRREFLHCRTGKQPTLTRTRRAPDPASMSLEFGLTIAGSLVALDLWRCTGVTWGALKLKYAASVRGARWLA